MRSPTSPIRSACRASLAVLTLSLALAACSAAATPLPTIGPSVPAATPSPSAVPGASGSASLAPTESPSNAPTVTPTITPTVAPTTSSGTCATSIAPGIAPSDRLTAVAVEAGIGVDKIVFTFGASTGAPSGTRPTGELHPTAPPFTMGGSGAPVDIAGHRFVAVTFRGMAIADEQGNPSYTGPSDIRPNALAVRELRLVDDFEGVVTWIVGVDGPGCVAVTRLTGPNRVVVAVTQP